LAPLRCGAARQRSAGRGSRYSPGQTIAPFVAEEFDKARTSREGAEAELYELQGRIAPLEAELNQLGRQFWVDKKQIVENKYDLSAGRYRDIEQEEAFLEKPFITLDRLTQLDAKAKSIVSNIRNLLP
jgi:type I restriction enzyme M protein